MTFDEMKAIEMQKRVRKPQRSIEHSIQCACFKWFSLAYPKYRGLLFAVPNGGHRNKIVASKMKAEGVVPGVADLILLVPKGGYSSLCIEMKTAKGRQTAEQKRWQNLVEKNGSMYVVCRSVDDFIAAIKRYINGNDS